MRCILFLCRVDTPTRCFESCRLIIYVQMEELLSGIPPGLFLALLPFLLFTYMGNLAYFMQSQPHKPHSQENGEKGALLGRAEIEISVNCRWPLWGFQLNLLFFCSYRCAFFHDPTWLWGMHAVVNQETFFHLFCYLPWRKYCPKKVRQCNSPNCIFVCLWIFDCEDYLHVYFTGIKMFLLNLIYIRITT